ncbi:hypothetical protein CDD82_6157 [Ophiocordyceps australis]|uniref:IEC3 subunit of the Ino80 complex, chromatin re-modelling-domain-containing protein n=1 Tax=Ophiocordyceps australis TaxID=1399860 RepID=A0A2C5ZRC0_9HYPO|nr:hypothetical protein CDD82_6157 [Ophiocordyceps australis]
MILSSPPHRPFGTVNSQSPANTARLAQPPRILAAQRRDQGPRMDDSRAKSEGATANTAHERRSSGYRSWKKKYRKMRITFEKHMHECEELHAQEEKASATVKRLAIDIDRTLDLLVAINSSPQIPPNKRIDLSLPRGEKDALALPIDEQHDIADDGGAKPLKKLQDLMRDVPHSTFASAPRDAPYMADLLASIAASEPFDARPTPFLTADDVDNYHYLIDMALDQEAPSRNSPHLQRLPTLASTANPSHAPLTHAQSMHKNPTSVTNWLRKHAPKVFLQDGEHHDGDDGDGAAQVAGRKARGERKADRAGASSRRGKRPSAATSSRLGDKPTTADWDASMDDDGDAGGGGGGGGGGTASASTPVPRNKRKRDEDGGYRPGGSATRPSKKKRKSDGDGTPAPRKPKKEATSKEY